MWLPLVHALMLAEKVPPTFLLSAYVSRQRGEERASSLLPAERLAGPSREMVTEEKALEDVGAIPFYTEGRVKGLEVNTRPGDVFICTSPKAGTTW